MEANQGVPGPRCAFYSLETFPGSRTGLPPAASLVQNLFLTFTDIPLDLRSISDFRVQLLGRLTCPFPPTWNTQTRTRSTFIGSRVSRVLTKGYSVPYRCHSVEKLINLASRFKHGRVPFWKAKRDISRLGSTCVLQFFGFAFECNHVYEERFGRTE